MHGAGGRAGNNASCDRTSRASLTPRTACSITRVALLSAALESAELQNACQQQEASITVKLEMMHACCLAFRIENIVHKGVCGG